MPHPNIPDELIDAAHRMKETLTHNVETQTAKLNDLRQQITDIDGFLNTLQRLHAGAAFSPQDDHNSRYSGNAWPNASKGETMKDLVERIAEQLLNEASVVPTAKIVEFLSEKGIKIGGKDPKANIAAILCKSPKFENSRTERGWKLKKTE